MLQPRNMSALENGLVAKGYKYVIEAKDANFVLSFTIGSREEIKVDSYPSMSADYGRAGRWGWGGAYYGYGTETQVRQYTKGMLAVDIFDVKERRPVWLPSTRSLPDFHPPRCYVSERRISALVSPS